MNITIVSIIRLQAICYVQTTTLTLLKCSASSGQRWDSLELISLIEPAWSTQWLGQWWQLVVCEADSGFIYKTRTCYTIAMRIYRVCLIGNVLLQNAKQKVQTVIQTYIRVLELPRFLEIRLPIFHILNVLDRIQCNGLLSNFCSLHNTFVHTNQSFLFFVTFYFSFSFSFAVFIFCVWRHGWDDILISLLRE